MFPTPAFAETVRIEVALVPEQSGYSRVVRRAAEAAGAVFVGADMALSPETAARVLVVDLTRALATARLGRRVVAIGRDPSVEAFDVVAPEDVEARLPRAVRNLVESETLRARVDQGHEAVDVLGRITHALAAESDRTRMLDRLLTHARALLRADAGSVYLLEGNILRFGATQSDTVDFESVATDMAVDDSSLVGWVAREGEPLHVADVPGLPPGGPIHHDRTPDDKLGYTTRSALLVPMQDRDGRTLGVLALFNRKPMARAPLARFDRVMPFRPRDIVLARLIADQAAVALENHRLYADIRRLFEGFVEAAVTAIESRDPSTGGHSHRVAALTTALAREVHDADGPAFRDVRFSPGDLTELHYAAMLHDFGKVGVREQVLLKSARLYSWEMEQVELRFRIAGMEAVLGSVRAELGADQVRTRLAMLEADLALVRRLNHPGNPVGPTDAEKIREIAARWHLGDLDDVVLRPHEATRLCTPRGSLDGQERTEIERHVEHTWRFLQAIPWTADLARVPELAYAHHERLDGTGYPRALREKDIPLGAQLMAITDIFDALTAVDRPYREALPPVRALRVLREEAHRGGLHREGVELFAARRVWAQIGR